MSMKISLEVFLLLTDTDDAEEFIVLGLNKEKLLIFLMSSKLLPFDSLITSLAIRGLICEVFVS